MLTAKEQLRSILNRQVSDANLAFKWAPREKSAKKVEAKALRNTLGMSPKEYRQFLAQNTSVVEQDMCAKEWNSINFSHVPSLASARYQKAFGRNAPEKYSEYIRELQKPVEERDPKVRVNSGAVYPYDVVKSLRTGNEAVANAQFDALPNYVGDTKIMPMVDVSGSMSSILAGGMSAMDVAISLGLYLSDRTTSDFKNMFITFTSSASIQLLKGTLSQKMKQMQGAVGYDTNLSSAFDKLLSTAKQGNVSPENMPDYILILSDMQFNDYNIRGTDATALELARQKYRDAGYKCPSIIFWNLTARADSTPVKTNDQGVALVSGFSPSIMASVLGADPEEFTPYNMMCRTILNPRYDY